MALGWLLAQRKERVVIIDADPYSSALRWIEEANGINEMVEGYAATTGLGLQQIIKIGNEHKAHVIIDTPPPSGTEFAKMHREAVGAADYVIVPTRPTKGDLDRLNASLQMVLAFDKVPVVLLVQTITRASEHKDIAAILAEQGVAVFENVVPMRQGIARAFGSAKPDRALYDAYQPVLEELLALDEQTRPVEMVV